MKKILNYKKIDYYLLNELLRKYPKYKYICERRELKSKIFSFYGERYITFDTWKHVVEMITMQEEYYSMYDVIQRLGYKEMYNKVKDEIFAILNTVVAPVVINDKWYYKKTDIDEIDSLSGMYSAFLKYDVIVGIDLIRYSDKTDRIFRYIESDMV
ncbi:MAG: hypothetical protein J6A03_13850 [Lachnospiraceae bacterium]|nr:hypothetical protein [Lachnospiraceae bacterium]